MLSIDFEGLPQLMQNLQRLASQAQQAMQVAIEQEAERILDASIPLVPIDTGLLVSTGMVERQVGGADIRYGGHGLAPYAAIVELDTTMNHPRGGQARYLTQPFLAALGGMPERLGRSLAPQMQR
jgi:hypothetical protein